MRTNAGDTLLDIVHERRPELLQDQGMNLGVGHVRADSADGPVAHREALAA
ncbi:hypothetical protein SDC9_179426 [bioreactor metagenome]|uniref:Uncharacterized protein n=1 Tax=bioreactor metagenome TaxID=1076179 RepID=A0A645GYU7_9ZZZZ